GAVRGALELLRRLGRREGEAPEAGGAGDRPHRRGERRDDEREAREALEDLRDAQVAHLERRLQAAERATHDAEGVRRDVPGWAGCAELLRELVSERDLRRPREAPTARDLVAAVEAALGVRDLLRYLLVLVRAALDGPEQRLELGAGAGGGLAELGVVGDP